MAVVVVEASATAAADAAAVADGLEVLVAGLRCGPIAAVVVAAAAVTVASGVPP